MLNERNERCEVNYPAISSEVKMDTEESKGVVDSNVVKETKDPKDAIDTKDPKDTKSESASKTSPRVTPP